MSPEAVTTDVEQSVADRITEEYQVYLSETGLNTFDVGEDLAYRIAEGEIDEEIAEEILSILSADEVTEV